MDWYWWILLIFAYIAGCVYFGTRFQGWVRRDFCQSKYADGDICYECEILAALGFALWPLLPPVSLLFTWLRRTARQQSKTSSEQRRIHKATERKRRAIAEKEAVDAETALLRSKQAREYAKNMLLPDGIQPDK